MSAQKEFKSILITPYQVEGVLKFSLNVNAKFAHWKTILTVMNAKFDTIILDFSYYNFQQNTSTSKCC